MISFWEERSWLHGCTKPSLQEIHQVEVLLSEKWRESLLFFLLMIDAQERPLWTAPAFKSYIPRLRYTSSAETEKMAHERPPLSHNPASNITHFATADQHSSWVVTTINAQCTLHCTVCDLNVKFCASQCKVGMIPYHVVCMTWCASVQCPWTATGAAVQCVDIVNCVPLCEAKITGTAVSLEEIHPTNRSETCLYDKSFRSRRWGCFHFSLSLLVQYTVHFIL